MGRITSVEIEKLKRNAFLRANRPFSVQIMDKETRTVIEEHSVNGWSNAHKYSYRRIKRCTDDQVIRIVDPKDASCYDFVTKLKLEKLSKGGKYNGYEEE